MPVSLAENGFFYFVVGWIESKIVHELDWGNLITHSFAINPPSNALFRLCYGLRSKEG